MAATCPDVSVQNHKIYTKINHNVNYELWVVMKCQYKFISCDRYTTLVGDSDNGEAVDV